MRADDLELVRWIAAGGQVVNPSARDYNMSEIGLPFDPYHIPEEDIEDDDVRAMATSSHNRI